MSFEFIEPSLIKEEEVCLNDSELVESDYCIEFSTKCGEIFLDQQRESYTFVCIFCHRPFKDLSSFGDHMHSCTTPAKEQFDDQVFREFDAFKKKSQVQVDSLDCENKNTEKNIDSPLNLIDQIKEENYEDETQYSNDDPPHFEEVSLQAESVDESLQASSSQMSKSEKMKKKYFKSMDNRMFCCFSCGQLFAVKVSLRNHYLAEHPDMIEKDDIIKRGACKIYEFVPKVPSQMSCGICLKTFHEPTAYHSHVEFDHIDKNIAPHTADRPFRCDICDRRFKLRKILQAHIMLHEDKKTFQCNVCSKNFEHYDTWHAHMKTHRRVESEATSPLETESQVNESQPKEPLKPKEQEKETLDTPDRPFRCDVCQKSFKLRKILNAHKFLHLDKKNFEFECKVCGKMFAQYAGLYGHMRSHRRIEYVVKLKASEELNQSNLKEADELKHEENETLDMMKDDSQHIENKFPPTESNTMETSAKKIESSKNETEIETGEQMQNKSTTHSQNQSNDKNLKTHVCPECDRAFVSYGNLKAHLVTHSNERPFSCDICNRKFKMKRILKAHMLIHLDKKKFECKVCWRTFAQYSGLYAHMKIHDEVEVVLTQGEKEDIHEQSNLKEPTKLNDELLDTNNDPPNKSVANKTFCCYSCGRLFAAKLSYRNHYFAHHPDMIEKDDIVQRGPLKTFEFVPKLPSEMSCGYCLKTFHEPKTYHSHMELDHIDKIYSCDICPATFTKSCERDSHLDEHDERQLHQCSHCDKKFGRLKHLQIHERIHTKMKSYQCDYCDQSFKSEIKFKRHRRKHNNLILNLTETSSQEPKPSESTVEEQNKVGPEETFCCLSCCKLFITKQLFRNHYYTHHPDMIEKDEIVDQGDSKVHVFVPKVPSEMLCRFCLKKFHEPTTYQTHVECDHITKRYSCDRCPATFKCGRDRDYHLNVHEGKKPFQCPHCPAKFANPQNRSNHIQNHLNKDKFICRFCKWKFARKVDCRIHERIHTNEKPYQCEECGEAFISRSRLTHHQRVHKNIRKYKCTQCDKAFFALSTLKAHITCAHTTERPFSCSVCDRKFRAQPALRAHKMLHLGKKTFKCKLCGKMFAQHAGLYAHMKSHNEVE